MTTRPGPDPLDRLGHDQLSRLVPELLLIGQLVDRAGMPALLSEFGLSGMRDVAIEEWEAVSPHYSRRMKDALRIKGDGVAEIFKGFQLDIGAPPEFMDFRYRVDDHDHGAFWLDHCGALMDVEPMGDELVRTMCHDIEDPTFPATALATNPRARVEPVHRPPRSPAGRTPHCEWRVVIDPDAEPLTIPDTTREAAGLRAVRFCFDPPASRPDGEPGELTDYSGPLLADLRFGDFAGATLVTIAREVYLQIHLLAAGFELAVLRRADRDTTDRIVDKQSAGIAGVASERIAAVLGGSTAAGAGDAAVLDSAVAVLELHPLVGPVAFTGAAVERTDHGVRIRWSRDADLFADEGWSRSLRPERDDVPPAVLAALRGIDSRFDAQVVVNSPNELVVDGWLGDESHDDEEAVVLTKFSGGATFEFGPPRPLLPLEAI